MRRTGKDLESPLTAIAACGGGGMTKDEAFMKQSQRVGIGTSIQALSGCADRRQRRGSLALLQAEERRIASGAAQEIVMPPALDDLAAFDHENGVGVHDGVQAVGDHDGGAVLAEMFDSFLHLLFGV